MAINNKNLVQEVQTLNQSLETSDITNIQNTISNSLLWLFTNEPSIVLNDELINQLTSTRDLVGVANRITTTQGKLANTVMSPNGVNIPSTLVNLVAPLSTQNIQREIDAINITHTPNLNNLPNQISSIKNRLNDNRWILLEIEDRQNKQNNITTTPRAKNLISWDISRLQNEKSSCASIRGRLQLINQKTSTLNNTTDPNKRQKIQDEIDAERIVVNSQITTLPNNLQTLIANNQVNGWIIGDFLTAETNLQVNLNTFNQELQDRTELDTLSNEIQTYIRRLAQTQIALSQGLPPSVSNSLVILSNQTPFPPASGLIANIDTAVNQVTVLENDLPQIKQRYEDNLKTLNELLPLQKLQEYLTTLHIAPGLSNTRSNEINQIVTIGTNIFNLGQNGFQHEVGSYTLWINGTLPTPIQLDPLFTPNGTTINQNGQNTVYHTNYSVAGPNGESLTSTGNSIQTTVDGQNISLTGITIQNGNLNIANLWVTPIDNIKFPLRLPLNVRARIQDPATGLLVDHFKPIILTINQPQLTQANRELAYDILNGNTNTITTRINIEHTNNNRTREDDVLREMVAAWGNQDEVDALRKDPTQAAEFIKRIRAIPGLIPVVPIAQATNHLQNGFRAEMTNPSRNVPIQHLVNQNSFIHYLRNNLDQNIQDYLKKQIRTTLDNPQNRNVIFRELLDFQTELKNNKVDSNIDQDISGDLVGVEMESKRDRWLFGRNDNNYMKFFSGGNIDLWEQNIDLNKPVKYTMKLKVSSKNQLSAIVKIWDKKEKEYKAGDPMSLMQKILAEKNIPEGKTRAHIAYNIAKWMIQKAKEEDISLSYRDNRWHNMVINLDGKNIVLEDQDDLTNHGGTNRRITQTLFDYSLFESTNSWESPNRSWRNVLQPDNRTLRAGIDRLTRHFNRAMNELNTNYNCATQRRMLGLLRSNTSSDFPTSAWTSPIKKLMNLRTTTNFDFSTSVSHNEKTVQIERKNNTFFLTIDGEEFKGKDLGKLLKKRKGWIRLFDGVERSICGEIYKNMVEKLRGNTKIARSSFGVMDPKTGRMYILDEDGQLGYLRAEEASRQQYNLRKNPSLNSVVNWVAIWWLTAAGIASGWAAALAAGLSWWAAGTAASWWSIAAPGTALFKDVRRITGRGYGTLAHSPAARTICDESETREVYKDPFLMGKLMKVMNLRLGQI